MYTPFPVGHRDYLRSDFDGGRPSFWATFPATKGLLVGLVAIHLLLALIGAASRPLGEGIRAVLELHPEDVLRRFFVWQIVTAGLIHGHGVWHLLFNCIVIWFFGRMVEDRLGARRFLLFCLAATIASSLAYLLESVVLSKVVPMLGASGAAMGITVLAALWYPRQTVLVFFVLPVQLWVLAVGLVVMDVVLLLDTPGGGIAHAAHLGGALYGWLHHKFGGVERLFAWADRQAERRRRSRQQRRDVEDAELRREVDRILDKVNREGMSALSGEEKRFLKSASARLRR